MNYAVKLDLDLSALPLDDFEVLHQELTVESLTAGHTMKPCTCECQCCNHCACPCVCCE